MYLLKSLERKTETSDEKLWYWIRCIYPNLTKKLVREYRFCERKFRFDFAFVNEKIAIECDGGTHLIKTKAGQLVPGRHSSDKDYEKRNIAALEFHHINPEDKIYDVKVLMTRRWELIKEEIDKCILLCSNCHRELHWNERQRKKLDNTL